MKRIYTYSYNIMNSLKVKLLDCATEIETTILRSTNLIYFVLILFIFYEIKYYFEGSIFLGGDTKLRQRVTGSDVSRTPRYPEMSVSLCQLMYRLIERREFSVIPLRKSLNSNKNVISFETVEFCL